MLQKKLFQLFYSEYLIYGKYQKICQPSVLNKTTTDKVNRSQIIYKNETMHSYISQTIVCQHARKSWIVQAMGSSDVRVSTIKITSRVGWERESGLCKD